jgi:hypothetical protein
MRLIDADKLHYIRKWFEDSGKSEVVVFAKEIDKAPTVQAITVEWLHSIMERQLIFAMESEMEGTTTVQDGVIHCVSGAVACQVLANVIELWKKENE